MATAAPERKHALSEDDLERLDRYWRATNYLAVGQIYLLDNPLLREPLTLEHVKPRLLGHWGTTPGLNFVYVHLNRVIREHDLSMIYICGPGHGGPAMVANTYLEGTFSELYSHVPEDEEGMKQLFKQFSFPGGVPSHAAPDVPGSIHEGGELGYAISHAFGAAFDNPDLVVACVIGDGEAESGPLATSWHSNKFLNPATDGAVLPILHLNGYKIANPTLLARMEREELESLLSGLRLQAATSSRAPSRPLSHRQMADTLDTVMDEIQAIQHEARENGAAERPRWPMIVLRTPKGWTGPKEVDGKKTEDYWRSHQVPLAELASESRAPRAPRGVAAELQAGGALRRGRQARARAARAGADRRPAHGREPARERRPAAPRPPAARLPRLRRRRPVAGRDAARGDAGARELPPRRDERRTRTRATSSSSRPTSSSRTASARSSR